MLLSGHGMPSGYFAFPPEILETASAVPPNSSGDRITPGQGAANPPIQHRPAKTHFRKHVFPVRLRNPVSSGHPRNLVFRFTIPRPVNGNRIPSVEPGILFLKVGFRRPDLLGRLLDLFCLCLFLFLGDSDSLSPASAIVLVVLDDGQPIKVEVAVPALIPAEH